MQCPRVVDYRIRSSPEFGRKIPLEITFLGHASDANQTVQRLENRANSDVLAYAASNTPEIALSANSSLSRG